MLAFSLPQKSKCACQETIPNRKQKSQYRTVELAIIESSLSELPFWAQRSVLLVDLYTVKPKIVQELLMNI